MAQLSPEIPVFDPESVVFTTPQDTAPQRFTEFDGATCTRLVTINFYDHSPLAFYSPRDLIDLYAYTDEQLKIFSAVTGVSVVPHRFGVVTLKDLEVLVSGNTLQEINIEANLIQNRIYNVVPNGFLAACEVAIVDPVPVEQSFRREGFEKQYDLYGTLQSASLRRSLFDVDREDQYVFGVPRDADYLNAMTSWTGLNHYLVDVEPRFGIH